MIVVQFKYFLLGSCNLMPIDGAMTLDIFGTLLLKLTSKKFHKPYKNISFICKNLFFVPI